MKTLSAAQFKAQCLKLMDEVQKKKQAILITKRGKIVAKLVPAGVETAKPLFGRLKGAVKVVGDIIGPTGEDWDADK